MDVLPSDSREPLERTLRKCALLLIAGQLKTLWTKASGLASPRKEMPKSTKAALVVNDDLPLSIVGRPSRETFPGNWIQSPKAFGTIEGKKRNRQESLSTQGSNEYPESKKTRETDSSPIQESVDNSNKEIERQELARTIELGVEIMPDDPQVAMSHATAMARIATTPNPSRTDLSLTTVFGTNIEFINNRWNSIFWSKSFNSYYTEKNQCNEEPGLLGLGSLARLLQTQETVEGKKRDGRESLSTQESSEYPVSRKTRERDSNPIQESISDSNEESRRQELAKSSKLNIGIMPTPDKLQTAMSHTAIRSPSEASPFSITGVTGSCQTAQRSGSSQAGSTSSGQRAQTQHTTGLGPSWGPASTSIVQQQRPQTPPAPPATPPEGPPGGQ